VAIFMKELNIIIIIIIIIILRQVVVVVNVNCIIFMASSTFQYWIMVLFWRFYPKKKIPKKIFRKIKKNLKFPSQKSLFFDGKNIFWEISENNIICVEVAKLLLHQVSHVLLVQLPTQTTSINFSFVNFH